MRGKAIQRIPRLTHHINLSVGMAHVTDNTAVLHSIQVLPGHNIFVPCRNKVFSGKLSRHICANQLKFVLFF